MTSVGANRAADHAPRNVSLWDRPPSAAAASTARLPTATTSCLAPRLQTVEVIR